MAKLDLIKSGEFKELSAQVFEQTLGGGGTYTAVLAEKEELALAEAVCLADARAIRFAKKYWEHYCPFNSAVSLMLEHIKCQAVADILLFIINKWSLSVEMVRNLCQTLIAEDCNEHIPLAKAWLKNHRTLSSRPELLFWFEKLDARFESKLADEYKALFANSEEEKKMNFQSVRLIKA